MDALATATREAVRAVDAGVPVEIEPLAARVAGTWADRRFNALLLGSFALVALALAAAGIYGVVSYAVERRRREAGIRIALGARPERVAALVRRDALAAVGVGLAAGCVGAALLSRSMSTLLFGVSPLDPLAFAGAAAVLAAVAWTGAAVPAHRATRVDPREAMRAE